MTAEPDQLDALFGQGDPEIDDGTLSLRVESKGKVRGFSLAALHGLAWWLPHPTGRDDGALCRSNGIVV